MEVGRRLNPLIKSDGWEVLEALMQDRVQEAENDLMNYVGSDREILYHKQRKARNLREFLDQLGGLIDGFLMTYKEDLEEKGNMTNEPSGIE